jgi:CheY-like chemotaxis protein
MIRVLLAEDQAMVRGALAALLSREQDIEVVAEVARGDEVVEAALSTRPDVALLDIEMPGGSGLDHQGCLFCSLRSAPTWHELRHRCVPAIPVYPQKEQIGSGVVLASDRWYCCGAASA